jgi:alkanesulfonate monooxygenase SsuD/methylene tetrahydromethanopterin reductase-like flavin-dependent oxidoreductase (luciferase family)
MTTPATFGIFDHIEDIPGTPTWKLFQDRIDFIKMAEEAGFVGFHLAEHHASDLCMAPNQESFMGAAAQATSTIRIGPLVKLLPLHHPVRIIEDMCTLDQLSRGRVDFGVGRGPVPVEHSWHGGDWRQARERFLDTLGIICDALANGEIRSDNSRFWDFPPVPMVTKPLQDPIPFWYPGSPATAGRHGMNLMWPGPIDQQAYEAYVEAWEKHKGDTLRVDGPNSKPRVGCVMLLAIADSESEALDVARRGMEGLVRRTTDNHKFDHLVVTPEECETALGPLRSILAHMDDAIRLGAGTAGQIAERLAGILEPGLTDYIVLQIPAGDMTLDEAKHTLEAFATEVKPQLEQAALAA